MVTAPPLRLNRSVLASVLKDNPEAIRQFENLFKIVENATADDAFSAIIIAQNAINLANLALAKLDELQSEIDILRPGTVSAFDEMAFYQPPAPSIPARLSPIIYSARGDGTTAAYTLPGTFSGLSGGDLNVILDGAIQVPTTDYVLSGLTLTFDEAPPFCPSTQEPNIIVRAQI